MELTVVCNVENLYSECVGHDIKIYGAKTVAIRTYIYLQSKKLNVSAFLVSNRYENVSRILGKPVLGIEDEENDFDCVVVAVSGMMVWDVEKELQQYHIKKIIVIHPFMDDEFPANYILSEKSSVSEKAFLSKQIQLIVDDTSVITIEDNVVVKEGAIILAVDHSQIYIGEGSVIGEKSFIAADTNATINIEKSAGFRGG